MKAFTIDTDSWHFYLAKTYGAMNTWDRPGDICQYTKYVLTGFMNAAIFVLAVGIGLGSMVDFAAFAYVCLFVSNIEAPTGHFTAIFTVLGAAIWTVLFLSFSIRLWQLTVRPGVRKLRKRFDSKPPKQPSFYRLAYDSLRYKFCVRVDYQDQKQDTAPAGE